MTSNEVPYGYCQCGCGKKTNRIRWSDHNRGLKKGAPYKYLRGHSSRKKISERLQKYRSNTGRMMVLRPNHPRSSDTGYVFNHILIVEDATGIKVTKDMRIHHVNLDKTDDRPCNLVLCENDAYHGLLHQRTTALKECGNANFQKCSICGKYDDPSNLYFQKKSRFHKDCRNKRRRKKYALGLPRW